MDESDVMMLFPVVGVTIGSVFGTMNNIIPFGFTFGMLIYTFLCVWKGVSLFGFSLLGMAWGSVFGAMAQVIPFDFVTLTWLGVFMVMLLDDAGHQGSNGVNSTRLFVLPLILITVGGIINTASPDFATTNGSNFATGWNGCVTTCAISGQGLSAIFTSGLFAPLAASPPNLCCSTASFVGGLFTSVTGISSLISILIGSILLLLGLGVGGQVSAIFASLGITINDAGARLCQALGFAMVLYAATIAAWGTWIGSLFQSTWELGLLLNILFPAVCFYGAYLRATIVTG